MVLKGQSNDLANVSAYLQYRFPPVAGQMYHRRLLLLLFQKVVVLFKSPLLFFISLLQVLRYLSKMLQTGSEHFREVDFTTSKQA